MNWKSAWWFGDWMKESGLLEDIGRSPVTLWSVKWSVPPWPSSPGLVWSHHPLAKINIPQNKSGWVGWGLSWCQPKFSARGWRTHVLPSDWFRQHVSKHLRNIFCKWSRQTRSEEKVGLLDQPARPPVFLQKTVFSRTGQVQACCRIICGSDCLLVCLTSQCQNGLVHKKMAIDCVLVIKAGKALFLDRARQTIKDKTRPHSTTPDWTG